MQPSGFLNEILERKRLEIHEARKAVPENRLRDEAESREDWRGFAGKLLEVGPFGANVIAEIKRASPSKGPIRADLDPAELARAYERGGAAAVSVLTERHYFKGSPEDLKKARSATELPVLRKDFLISAYQIYEAAAMGADAALLIVRALPPEVLQDLTALCQELRLDALVEVHSEWELETASRAGARLVGINNRNLETFETDIANCMRMARYLDKGQTAVAESGISGRKDILKILETGIWNFLIGESAVRSEDPEEFLKTLLGRSDAGGEHE
jgi:indole-3-glycerol phosphate synthase